MEPTKKNPVIADLVNSFIRTAFNGGQTREDAITEGNCTSCDTTGVVATSFRDDISRKEYAISGFCQSCQDDVFGVGEPDDDEWDDDEPSEMSDMEADADTLASAGWGTDEDYGSF